MKYFIINILSKYGYAGIIILIILENIFPPIPSELILTISGFLAKEANMSIPLLILSSTIASTIGAIILYYLGYYLNNSLINILSKVIKKDKITSTIYYFKEKGFLSIFYSRLIPIVRSLISIPAGISKMNITLFIILTFIGSLIWNTILILTGNILGENYDIILYILDKYKLLIIILIIVGISIKIFTHKK